MQPLLFAHCGSAIWYHVATTVAQLALLPYSLSRTNLPSRGPTPFAFPLVIFFPRRAEMHVNQARAPNLRISSSALPYRRFFAARASWKTREPRTLCQEPSCKV